MDDLTYEIYLASPAVREQLEREVRRARIEAIQEYLAAPLARMVRRIFVRAQPKPAPSLKMSGIAIARGSVLRVENARDMQVQVEQGTLWITQEGDTSDVVLARGESFRLDRDGLTLLHACAPLTCVSLAPAF